ncbi:hypothetical protein M3152_08390 [Sporosarcina luteola]|uniref:hypothetical protein n=1 Tax=Sporosarcina luteola TaxID=582850 RepID=UPI00203B51B7|nr:hypothetical protein [Sporosarcina luteola]MCM3637738.1 hypothetical protein [Sporosarcina luteola]
MTNNRNTSEVQADLVCQAERIEAIHAFLEDVIELYSNYGMGRDLDELQSANLKLISLSSFLERELNDMKKTMDELLQTNREGHAVFLSIKEIADTLDAVLQQEAPHIMITSDGINEKKEEITREEMLVHHIEIAVQDLYEITEEENGK